MARRGWLARVLIYGMLELGALGGLPMRPEHIEELTRLLQRTAVEHVVRREDSGDGDPPAGDETAAARAALARAAALPGSERGAGGAG